MQAVTATISTLHFIAGGILAVNLVCPKPNLFTPLKRKRSTRRKDAKKCRKHEDREKWKLNSLISGIHIKSKNQTRWNWDTKYQFGWHLHSQGLSFVAEAFGFGWQGYVQENSSFGNSLSSLWQSQCTFRLVPSSSGKYFGYSFLKYAHIWKEKQDNHTAMQILCAVT